MTPDEVRRSCEALDQKVRATCENIAKLAETVARNERRWDKFRRALRAGLDQLRKDDPTGNW